MQPNKNKNINNAMILFHFMTETVRGNMTHSIIDWISEYLKSDLFNKKIVVVHSSSFSNITSQ